ncbi:hypothetical protein E2I00_006711 [Balaenoptera physalus]|uniref:MAP3K12-binding inhibitory protein 1 n=1 Tax=Balaenoptera physalus TaxID=9770 RepID=A0A643BZB7_BALPH|nr:hypothetical protein E2I00_006711 [Balaenoptera physalus]
MLWGGAVIGGGAPKEKRSLISKRTISYNTPLEFTIEVVSYRSEGKQASQIISITEQYYDLASFQLNIFAVIIDASLQFISNQSIKYEVSERFGLFEPQQMELCSQPFLAKLQPLIKEENTTVVEEIGKTETGNKNEVNAKFPIGDLQEEEKHKDCDLGDVKKTQIHFDPEVVQIKAGKAEIDRRISAFIERKQAEINENNVREFCNVIDCNQVSRVVNTYGPQTRPEGIQGSGHKPNSMLRDCGNQAVEERLQNIEAHLRLQTGGPVPRDIYQRIKKLEDRILELEGISPEYFQSVVSISIELLGKQGEVYFHQGVKNHLVGR